MGIIPITVFSSRRPADVNNIAGLLSLSIPKNMILQNIKHHDLKLITTKLSNWLGKILGF